MPVIAESSSGGPGFFSFGPGPSTGTATHFPPQPQPQSQCGASPPAASEAPYAHHPSMPVLMSPFDYASRIPYTSASGSGSSTGGSVPRTPELSAASGSTSSNAVSAGAASPTWSQDLFGCHEGEGETHADDLFGDGDGGGDGGGEGEDNDNGGYGQGHAESVRPALC